MQLTAVALSAHNSLDVRQQALLTLHVAKQVISLHKYLTTSTQLATVLFLLLPFSGANTSIEGPTSSSKGSSGMRQISTTPLAREACKKGGPDTVAYCLVLSAGAYLETLAEVKVCF